MNKIFNWTFGSIFRTLGRIIAYIIIAIIAVMIFNHGGFKKPKISNILNDILFMRVNAATFTQDIKQTGNYYLGLDSYNGFGADGTYLNKTIVASNSIISSDFVLDSTTIDNVKNHEYVQFNFMITNSGQGIEYNGNQIVSHTCKYWSCPTSNTLTLCTCTDYDNYTSQVWEDDIVGTANFSSQNISAKIDYNGWYAPCNVQNNNIICPTNKQNYYKIILDIAYFDSQSNSPRIYIQRTLSVLDNVNAAEQIINNQNQNTQATIDNQNANTNATIENQNQNTQQQIDSQKVCKTYDKSAGIVNGYLNVGTGEIQNDSSTTTTDYIRISANGTTIKTLETFSVQPRCFYNENKVMISCTSSVQIDVNIPIDTYYIRFSISKRDNKPIYQICTNGNQAMANTITDSNVSEANSSAGGFFNNFSTTDNGGLSSIITAPLSAIQSLTSASCSPLVLPLPFVNENLTLPCMRTIYESNFGGFMTLYDVITLGIISYWILVRIFNLVKDFKNPDHDEIEVVDL